MGKLQDKVYHLLPHYMQNILISLFDIQQYSKRHSGQYKYFTEYYRVNRGLALKELKEKQLILLRDFLKYVQEKSKYYKPILSTTSFDSIDSLLDSYTKLPIQSKEDIRANINEISTLPQNEAVLFKTGGTTGKSMEVRFTYDDIQNRFALLDSWRLGYGYKLGKKVAWFSGKSLLSNKDILKNRYWKYDFVYKKRYYSTFHINARTAKYYIDDLRSFQPHFAVGFPSSMYEIAKWGIDNNYSLGYKMNTIFPTAETIIESEKEVIENFFGGRVVNQYASSEGAPFILECYKGKLHMELLSGYFEVLDNKSNPTNNGELVFTSFTTHGTPLIRYAIKDNIALSNEVCNCGNFNPIVTSIEGRINDFVYSKEHGKINLGNISNCVKYVKGVIKFQIVQEIEDEIDVLVVKDKEYTYNDEVMFKNELIQRLGNKMRINFHYVNEIAKEPSGKYRIVKQSLIIK